MSDTGRGEGPGGGGSAGPPAVFLAVSAAVTTSVFCRSTTTKWLGRDPQVVAGTTPARPLAVCGKPSSSSSSCSRGAELLGWPRFEARRLMQISFYFFQGLKSFECDLASSFWPQRHPHLPPRPRWQAKRKQQQLQPRSRSARQVFSSSRLLVGSCSCRSPFILSADRRRRRKD